VAVREGEPRAVVAVASKGGPSGCNWAAVQWWQCEEGPCSCGTDGRPCGSSRECWEGGMGAHGRVGKTAEAAVTAGWATVALQHVVAATRDHTTMSVSTWRPGDQ
jgi:hypothetical protein